MKSLQFAVIAASLFSATVHAQEEFDSKLYKSARCDGEAKPRIAGKATLRCNFKSGSANLGDDPTCVTQVEPILRDLQVFKDVRIMILGFADAKGAAEKNKSLSIERASAVRKYLIDGGLAGERFSVDGFGSEPDYLLCKDKSKECDAQNRRIEVVKYLCKKPKQAPAPPAQGK